MKKALKFVGALATLSAAVAGGIALYKKFFAPEDDFSDLDGDLEDEFEEEDLDAGETPAERGYVALNHLNDAPEAEETAEPEDEKAEAATETQAETAPEEDPAETEAESEAEKTEETEQTAE